MEQSYSWEADCHAAGKEITRISWNPLNSLYTLKFCFYKIDFNIVLPSPCFQVLRLKFCTISGLPTRVTCPTHLVLLDIISLILKIKNYEVSY